MGMHPFYKSQTKYTTRKVILKILIQTIEIKKAPWQGSLGAFCWKL